MKRTIKTPLCKISAMLLTLCIVMSSFVCFPASAETTPVANDCTPEQWAAELLDEGSNITFNAVNGCGDITSGAVYTYGTNRLDEALVLSTYSSHDSDETTMDGHSIGTMLSDMAGYNFGGSLSYVEVETVAVGNVLKFNYAFITKEFDQSAKYNDSFGLFVSEEDGQGGWSEYKNIAIIPGTQKSVNIQNLLATNGSWSKDGTLLGTNASIPETAGGYGITPMFTAQAAVEPGTKIRVLFAICDISDTSYDSAVVIAAHSFAFDPPAGELNFLETAEYIEELVPNEKYKIEIEGSSAVYEINADANGCIPFVGNDNDGNAYDFWGRAIRVRVWNEEYKAWSSFQRIYVTNKGEPVAPENPTVPSNKYYIIDPDVITTSTSITVTNAVKEQTYFLYDENGDLYKKAKGVDGTVDFTELSSATLFYIATSYNATRNYPVSASSIPEEVMTLDMIQNVGIIEYNYLGVYDELTHSSSIILSNGFALDANSTGIVYAAYYPEDFEEDVPEFVNPDFASVYYGVSFPNMYTYWGELDNVIQKLPAVEVETAGYTGVYDGNRHTGIASSAVPENTYYYYSLDKAEWSYYPIKIADVGEYTVYVKAVNPIIADSFGEFKIEITPVDVTIIASDATKEFGETDPEFEYVIENLPKDAELEVEITREKGEIPGVYNLFVDYEESPNFNVTVSGNATLTITPGENFAVAAPDQIYTFNSSAQGVAVIPSTTESTSILYSADYGETWSETVPQYTYVGNHTIYVCAMNSGAIDPIYCSYNIIIDYVDVKVTVKDTTIEYDDFDSFEPEVEIEGLLDENYELSYYISYYQIEGLTYAFYGYGTRYQGVYRVKFVPGTVIINKGAAAECSAEGYDDYYDGNIHQVVFEFEDEEYEDYYSVYYSVDSGATWISEVPCYKEVGEHEIMIKATSTYHETIEKVVTIKIRDLASEPEELEPEEQEPQKEEPKEEEPKKEEPKEEEPKEEEPKEQEPQEQEPQKQEPKEEEPIVAPVTGDNTMVWCAIAAVTACAAGALIYKKKKED